jgi:hypothetical protein
VSEPTNDAAARGAELAVEAVEAAPGRSARALARLTNRSGEARTFELAVHGFEQGWVVAPSRVGPLADGETAEVPLVVHLPAGYPPCRLVGALRAWDASVDARADLVVSVRDAAAVQASLEPTEPRSRRRGRFEVVLRNRGQASTKVALEPRAGDSALRVRLAELEPVLPPGRELRVAGRVEARWHLRGSERRLGFGVRVQARSTPFVLEGSFLQRPLLQGGLVKAAAIACVVALWIAAAAVGIGALSAHLQKSATAKAASSSPTSGPASPTGGPGSSVGGALAAPARPSQGTVRVGGKVSGAEPGGVKVTITPTSLSDPSASGATLLGGASAQLTSAKVAPETVSSSPAPLGMVYGTAVGTAFDAGLTAVAGMPTISTLTAPDGTWAISGLKAPGTYLVTFSKPGFATRKYLLTASSPGSSLELNTTISPGFGSISGIVSGPTGAPLGGVSLTLSDGTVTLTTRTPSVGAGLGRWSLTGLTTPDTYLVSATKPGYGTATTLVRLAPSASARDVRLVLQPGVGTITGVVVSARSATGIGGITVSATGGSMTESATTTTEGVVGSYTLPNLPVPGSYALTFSGPGWVTQTREVHLSANAVVGASLVPSGADVIGFAYDAKGAGLPAAGVVLQNASATFKTLTQSTAPVGRFDFTDVPPGDYVLIVEDYGYATSSAEVVVRPGEVTSRSLVLAPSPPASLDTGTIRGTVNDLFDSSGVEGVALSLDGRPDGQSGPNGTYELNNVAPGVHVVSALPTPAQGLAPASVQVNVPLGGTVLAPVLNLPRLDGLAGLVKSAADGKPVAGATVQLYPPNATTASSSASSPLASATANSAGTYSLSDLQSGNYQLVVSAPGYETATLAITLAIDENLNQNVTLTLAPDFNVVTYAIGASGGVQQIGGVCVTLSGPSYAKTELSSATGPITFTPLVAGDSYTASFWQPSQATQSSPVSGVPPSPCPQNSPEAATAASTTFVAQANNTSIYSAFLAPQLPALSVTLSFRYELKGSNGAATTVDCPAVAQLGAPNSPVGCPILSSLPTLSATGTTSFSQTTNGTLGTPISSSPIAAISPAGTTSDTWSFPASAFSSLVSNQITLNIDGTSTPLQSLSQTETLSGSSAMSLSLVLSPTPVVVTGTVSPPAASVQVSPDQIPVSAQQGATSPDAISVSSNAGALEWADSQVGAPGLAQPGVYDLSASATGYESATEEVTPGVVGGVLTGAPLSVTLSLTQETTLTVSPSSYVSFPGLPGPTVTLLFDNAAVSATNGGPVSVVDSASQTTSSTGSIQLSAPSDSAVFTYLSPSAEQAALSKGDSGYVLEISAPGYQSYFDPLQSLAPSMTVDPPSSQLLEESVVTGTLEGTIDSSAASPLAGVTLSATLTAGSCPAAPSSTPPGFSAAPPTTLTATTSASGTYVLVGDASGTNLNGGLCPGASYTISASLPGYSSATTTLTGLQSGLTTVSPNLSLAAVPMTQEIEITPAGGGSFSPNAEPTVSVSNSLGAHFVCQVGATGTTECPSPTGSANVAVQVYPTAYTYTISAPDYVPLYLSAISYAPGASPPLLTETLQSEENNIQGTVTEAPPQGGAAKAVPGLTLDLSSAANPGQTLTSTATSASGTYSFSNIQSGSYDLNPDPSTGYVATSGSSFATAYPSLQTTANLSVEAVAPTTFEVELTSTAPGASDLSGATVTLTPIAEPSPAPSCVNPGAAPLLVPGLGQTVSASASSNGSGVIAADFTQVTPDYYSLSVSGPQMPAQQATDIEICPTTSPSTPATTTYSVQQGELAGTLTLTSTATTTGTPLSVVPSVEISNGTLTSTATVTGTCDAGEATCGFDTFVALGPSYTTTASASGYPNVTPPSYSFTPTGSNASDKSEDFTLSSG